MEMTLYSLILSVGALTIFAVTIITFFSYVSSENIRKKLSNIDYFTYMKLIGAIAILSTTFALTYQLYYDLQVCILCWWQRIFIFPIDIVVIVTLLKKIRGNHLTTGILALIGLFFAGYHYYYHFIGWVLKLPVYLPCEQGGLLPACTDHDGVLTFGFVTIPGMAVCVLTAMVWLSYLASRTKK